MEKTAESFLKKNVNDTSDKILDSEEIESNLQIVLAMCWVTQSGKNPRYFQKCTTLETEILDMPKKKNVMILQSRFLSSADEFSRFKICTVQALFNNFHIEELLVCYGKKYNVFRCDMLLSKLTIFKCLIKI